VEATGWYVLDVSIFPVKLTCYAGKNIPESNSGGPIVECKEKCNKCSNLELLLLKKIVSIKYPMQELELNHPTTEGKVQAHQDGMNGVAMR